MLNRVVEDEEVRAFVELPEKAKVLMPITRKRLRDQEKSWRLPRKAPGLDLYTFFFSRPKIKTTPFFFLSYFVTELRRLN